MLVVVRLAAVGLDVDVDLSIEKLVQVSAALSSGIGWECFFVFTILVSSD